MYSFVYPKISLQLERLLTFVTEIAGRNSAFSALLRQVTFWSVLGMGSLQGVGSYHGGGSCPPSELSELSVNVSRFELLIVMFVLELLSALGLSW